MQWEELAAQVEAFKTTNKELQSSIEKDKEATKMLRRIFINAQSVKHKFLDSCSVFNTSIRCCLCLYSGCFHDNFLASCDCVLTAAAADRLAGVHTSCQDFESDLEVLSSESITFLFAGSSRRSTLRNSSTMGRRDLCA